MDIVPEVRSFWLHPHTNIAIFFSSHLSNSVEHMYPTSATLLERVRQRTDRAAWNQFAELYTPFLYHCARTLGLADSDAADAVQDVFVLLLEKLPDFQYAKDGSFRAWLRTVTVNKCRERFRKRQEVAIGGSDLPGMDQIQANNTDALWDTEYRQYLVARALAFMQSEFETTTWKACWETTVKDRRTKDVAADLGITINAVFVARSRVLRRLRKELSDLVEF